MPSCGSSALATWDDGTHLRSARRQAAARLWVVVKINDLHIYIMRWTAEERGKLLIKFIKYSLSWRPVTMRCSLMATRSRQETLLSITTIIASWRWQPSMTTFEIRHTEIKAGLTTHRLAVRWNILQHQQPINPTSDAGCCFTVMGLKWHNI